MKPYINMTLLAFATTIVFTACEKKADPITEAEQADKKAGIEVPSIEEVKAIAEEGFIYGLPIVMNYTVNYEFWVDKVNGWSIASAFGDREFYNGDWLLRAAAVKAGIYGNDAVEAVYPMVKTLPNGELLDGSKANYTLTFPAGQLPPVNAFWSVTMYDGKTQLLIKNPINRYLINSPMLPEMKKNADGSLTLYIQKDSPGADKESNWLPAPSGPIYMVMRLYWPKTEAPSILPPGEGTWAPPGIVQADLASILPIRQLPVKSCAKWQEVFRATSIYRVKSGLEWTFGITRTSGSKQEIEKVKMRTAKCKMKSG